VNVDSCSNVTAMRFKAVCNGYLGFASWTKYSPWIAVGSGKSVVYTFPGCGSGSGSLTMQTK
jgi:hypothetical protein